MKSNLSITNFYFLFLFLEALNNKRKLNHLDSIQLKCSCRDYFNFITPTKFAIYISYFLVKSVYNCFASLIDLEELVIVRQFK